MKVMEDAGLSPYVLADIVILEIECLFKTKLPKKYADIMVERAEGCFNENMGYRKRILSSKGRDWCLSFFRHWLSGLIFKDNPKLFKKIPACFKKGISI